jgi:hypothetical protein
LLICKFLIVRKYFLLFVMCPIVLVLFLVSCQKELSREDAATSGGTAKYSFEGGTGSCTGASVFGGFTAGTAVTAANEASISVNVDSIGSYIISTNTVNGLSLVVQVFLPTKGFKL